MSEYLGYWLNKLIEIELLTGPMSENGVMNYDKYPLIIQSIYIRGILTAYVLFILDWGIDIRMILEVKYMPMHWHWHWHLDLSSIVILVR